MQGASKKKLMITCRSTTIIDFGYGALTAIHTKPIPTLQSLTVSFTDKYCTQNSEPQYVFLTSFVFF